jgi:hypothetical protein
MCSRSTVLHYFWNSEEIFTITFQRLEQFGVGPQTLSAIEAGLFHFQGQLREFYCYDSPRKPQLQQIYNLGVNLGWGFAFCVFSHDQNDVRAALDRARAHANAAQIFNNPEADITLHTPTRSTTVLALRQRG